MSCEKDSKKDSKKEWENKNNIKIAIIGGPRKKMTLAEYLEKIDKLNIQENEQEER